MRPERDPDELISFSTSGSTGTPVHWLRTPRQLRAEVTLVSEVAFGAVDRVVCFAPPVHLFGRLFGRELPAWQGIPVVDAWREPTTPPVVEPGLRTLFVCLPASWPLLRSVAARIAELPGAVALHGTGLLPPAAIGVVNALAEADFRAAEIFGSTETGGIAVRDLLPTTAPAPSASGRAGQAGVPPQPWTLLPDVDLLAPTGAEEGLLRISSPRLARRADLAEVPASWESADLVRRVDDRHFQFLGRSTRMVKVNGIRCDLDLVERAVAARFPELDVVAVPVTDDTRGEHYELYCATKGHPALDVAAVAAAVADRGGLPVPRRVHLVGALPRTATGKVRLAELTGEPATGRPGRSD
ncbi:MAG TPA: class I adenylate-forming enzyme family protein [Pseudonocardiaceae bacterium]|nr:class I adenylate-forming enzyme family protein [Pseudonocardiaceae bacterium]